MTFDGHRGGNAHLGIQVSANRWISVSYTPSLGAQETKRECLARNFLRNARLIILEHHVLKLIHCASCMKSALHHQIRVGNT
jgi:hypothetical protein